MITIIDVPKHSTK